MYDTYKGALADKPIRNFSIISLKSIANADFKGDEKKSGVNAWTNEDPSINDMINFPTGEQTFHEIPFDIIDPAQNQSKGLCDIICSQRISKVKNYDAQSKSCLHLSCAC